MNHFYNKSLFLFLTAFFFGLMAFGQEAFISVWKSNSYGISSNNQILVPLQGEYQYTWFEIADPDNSGEGTDTDEILITFPSSGIYEVSFAPTGENPLHQIQFNGDHENAENDAYKLREIKQWGDIQWSSFEKAFNGTENLSITATDIPDVSNVTNMSQAFRYSGITQVPNMNEWDVSQVENMSGLFEKADSFNTDITSWEVGQVNNMSKMFAEARSFQQPIGVWDVSSVTDMSYMFYDYEENVLAKSNSANSTMDAGFNQPLNEWDVSNVTNMQGMFAGSFSFNQPINDWDVSSVNNMIGMFNNAYAFDQPLNNWNVSSVTNMSGMFAGAKFNEDISTWDVSNVETMVSMFWFAYRFNQDISNWDVSNVSDFTNMFGDTEAFDQPLGNWTFKDNANGLAMFYSSNLSCLNLSLSIQGWAANPEMGVNINIDTSTSYSPEVNDDLNYLINNLNWSIGAYEGNCTLSIAENTLSDLTIFPNPTSDYMQISGLTEIDKVEIFDIQGKNILQINGLSENEKIDLTKLSSGIYWIALSIDNQKTVKKLIIQ